MTRSQAPVTIGLFADGPVGDAILRILAARCPSQLSYVVTPSSDSIVAKSYVALSLQQALFDWSVLDQRAALPCNQGHVPDIVFLAWWPHLVRRDFLSAGQFATLNTHPSLLPFGRGKDPNFWTLAEGDPFGVTIHHVDEGVDTGPIAFQAAMETGWIDTGATLYARAQARLVELFSESLDAILSLAIPRTPQPEGVGSFHKRADLDSRSVIDLNGSYTGRDLLNLVRARTFKPHPACRFRDGDETYQVRIEIEKIEDQT